MSTEPQERPQPPVGRAHASRDAARRTNASDGGLIAGLPQCGELHSTLSQLNGALQAKRQPFDRIPIVDIGPLLDGSDPAPVAKDIRWALANVGFMYIRNHGIATETVDAAFAQTRAFFDLSMGEKNQLHIANSGPGLRGYTGVFGENVDSTRTKDFKECFDIGPETPDLGLPFFGANQWPASLPGFREAVYGYHEEMKRLSVQLLRGIALSLDLAPDFSSRRCATRSASSGCCIIRRRPDRSKWP